MDENLQQRIKRAQDTQEEEKKIQRESDEQVEQEKFERISRNANIGNKRKKENER